MDKLTDREEWLQVRAKCVNSTESPALFGMSPYMTAYELGVMKRDGSDYFDRTERTNWGVRLQDAIAQGVSDDYRVLIKSLEYHYAVHPNARRMGASFDYEIVGVPTESTSVSEIGALYEQHGPGLLEIKNVDWLVYKNWPDHDAPDHIEIQVQHQLEVADVEWAVLAVLVGGNRTEVYTRMRDRTVGAAIASRVSKFWMELERGNLPPPIMPQDADLIIKLHQYADPNKVFNGQGDATLASLCDEYICAAEVAKDASDAQKSLKAKILTHIGDAEKALTDGFRLSAAMRAPSEVKAHTRAGFRDFRVTRVEGK
jgi:putative phage-type endonuclease